jgi:hypothetical protein
LMESNLIVTEFNLKNAGPAGVLEFRHFLKSLRQNGVRRFRLNGPRGAKGERFSVTFHRLVDAVFTHLAWD